MDVSLYFFFVCVCSVRKVKFATVFEIFLWQAPFDIVYSENFFFYFFFFFFFFFIYSEFLAYVRIHSE